MILALPLPPIRGWDQCLACGKLTYLLQAHTSSHDSERGHCSVGVTPLKQGLGSGRYWSYDPGACLFLFPDLSFLIMKWG